MSGQVASQTRSLPHCHDSRDLEVYEMRGVVSRWHLPVVQCQKKESDKLSARLATWWTLVRAGAV